MEPEGNQDPTMLGPSLLDLPDDIILHILKDTSSYDIISISFACMRLARISRDHTLWTHADFIQPTPQLLTTHKAEIILEYLTVKTKSLRIRAIDEPEQLFSHHLLRRLAKTCPDLRTLALENWNLKLSVHDFPRKLWRLSIAGSKPAEFPAKDKVKKSAKEQKSRSYLFGIFMAIPRLQSLDLSRCQWMDNHSLLALSKCQHLRELSLNGCSKMGGCVAYSSLATGMGFYALERLDMRDTKVEDIDLKNFLSKPNIEQLFVGYNMPLPDPKVPLTDVELEQWDSEQARSEPKERQESPDESSASSVDDDDSASDDSDDDSDDRPSSPKKLKVDLESGAVSQHHFQCPSVVPEDDAGLVNHLISEALAAGGAAGSEDADSGPGNNAIETEPSSPRDCTLEAETSSPRDSALKAGPSNAWDSTLEAGPSSLRDSAFKAGPSNTWDSTLEAGPGSLRDSVLEAGPSSPGDFVLEARPSSPVNFDPETEPFSPEGIALEAERSTNDNSEEQNITAPSNSIADPYRALPIPGPSNASSAPRYEPSVVAGPSKSQDREVGQQAAERTRQIVAILETIRHVDQNAPAVEQQEVENPHNLAGENLPQGVVFRLIGRQNREAQFQIRRPYDLFAGRVRGGYREAAGQDRPSHRQLAMSLRRNVWSPLGKRSTNEKKKPTSLPVYGGKSEDFEEYVEPDGRNVIILNCMNGGIHRTTHVYTQLDFLHAPEETNPGANVTDDFVRSPIRCKKLKVLALGGCTRITNVTLDFLVRYDLNMLRLIDVRGTRVNSLGIDQIQAYLGSGLVVLH